MRESLLLQELHRFLWEGERPAEVRPEEQKYPAQGQSENQCTPVNSPESNGNPREENIIYLHQLPLPTTCIGYMNSPFSSFRFTMPAAFVMLLATGNCVEKLDPSIKAQYQETADRFCHAVVECLKDDLAKRMEKEPQKRDLFLSRMDRDLCLEGQYEKISGLQNHMDQSSILDRYQRCSEALEADPNCQSRIAALKSNPDCKSIRSASEFP